MWLTHRSAAAVFIQMVLTNYSWCLVFFQPSFTLNPTPKSLHCVKPKTVVFSFLHILNSQFYLKSNHSVLAGADYVSCGSIIIHLWSLMVVFYYGGKTQWNSLELKDWEAKRIWHAVASPVANAAPTHSKHSCMTAMISPPISHKASSE